MAGDRTRGAISCAGFRDDGAFNSHFDVDLGGVSGEDLADSTSTVESAFSNFGIVDTHDVLLSIGTNADLTTSICSSSESSAADEFSWHELISNDEFIFIDILCVDGGLDDDGRDDAGDRCAELKCSIFVDIGGVACEAGLLFGCSLVDIFLCMLVKSYGKNGCLCRRSGWAKGNCGK